MSGYAYVEPLGYQHNATLPNLLNQWAYDKTKSCENCRYFKRCDIKNYQFEEAADRYKINVISINQHHVTICGFWNNQ